MCQVQVRDGDEDKGLEGGGMTEDYCSNWKPTDMMSQEDLIRLASQSYIVRKGSQGNKKEEIEKMTGRCMRCGTLYGEEIRVGDRTYTLCDDCHDFLKELFEGVAEGLVRGHMICFIGFRAMDIPELKRLFALSENEDIRKMVEFLEGVEADLPKEEEE